MKEIKVKLQVFKQYFLEFECPECGTKLEKHNLTIEQINKKKLMSNCWNCDMNFSLKIILRGKS